MHFRKSLLILSVIGCVFLCSSAFAEQSGDFTYTVANSQVTITGYTGAGGAVVIPDTIEGLPVVNIGNSAFYSKTSMTGINIPSSVTSIGYLSFCYCTGLTSLAIPSSVTSIGDSAFAFCAGLTSVTIPDSVVSIGTYVFYNCTRLTGVIIGSGVTNIGEGAFYKCARLASAYFYGNAPVLGTLVFSNCASGFTVYYVAEATGFTNPWYGYPTALFDPAAITTTTIITTTTSTTIPTATTIPTTTTTTSTITTWGGYEYRVSASDNVTITKYIGSGGNVVIPDTINGMPVVAIQEGYTYSSVPFTPYRPATYQAFYGCAGLTSVTIPAGITSIGGYAFGNCSSLASIVVDPGNPAYSSHDGVLYNKAMTTLLQYPGGRSGAFRVPDGVTGIAEGACMGCAGLTSVTLPSSVSTLVAYSVLNFRYQLLAEHYGSFQNCLNLTAVYFEGNAPAIEHYHGSSCGMDFTYMWLSPFMNCTDEYSCPSIITVYYTAGATGFASPWCMGAACFDNNIICYPTAVFTDVDSDRVPDAIDNCPAVANPQQRDADTDGIGDVCDETPGCGGGCGQVFCEGQMDTDGDGFADASDNCPALCNADQLDADSDGSGDVCDTEPGCGGEGQPVCETSCDTDSDGVYDVVDNCPNNANPQQLDADDDGIGDVCDTAPGCGGCGQVLCEGQVDTDGDSFPDSTDNCPALCNRYQMDADSDGSGDVCDADPGCGADGQPVCEAVCAL